MTVDRHSGEELERALQDLQSMDERIEGEWGVGKYEPVPIIAEVEALISVLRSEGAEK